jgi:hypothetical protein
MMFYDGFCYDDWDFLLIENKEDYKKIKNLLVVALI